MSLIRQHRKCLPPPIRIHQRYRHQILLLHTKRVSNCQRVAQDRLDRPPDVNNLEAGAEEGGREVGEVVWDAGCGGGVGLVDMNAGDGAAEGGGWGGSRGRGWGAPDCVVEYEDAGGAGAWEVSVQVTHL
jgi:hypothetical protein